MQCLRDYAAAKGYQVMVEVTEIASGINDDRPKLNKLLRDPKIGVIVVEHKDRLRALGGDTSRCFSDNMTPAGDDVSIRHRR